MPRGRLSKAKTTCREDEIISLLRKGYSQYDVANMLGISQPSVSDALKRVSDRMQRSSAAGLEAMRQEHSAKLEQLYLDAIEMYSNCKANNDMRNASKYQEVAAKMLTDIRKIWGTDAPTRSENENKNLNANVGITDESSAIFERLAIAADALGMEKEKKIKKEEK